MPARRRPAPNWERNLTRIERQLPAPVARLLRDLVKNLREAQRQLEAARAEREARLTKLQHQLRRDAARLLRQLEKAVEPPKKTRRARPRKSGRARRSPTSAESSA